MRPRRPRRPLPYQFVAVGLLLARAAIAARGRAILREHPAAEPAREVLPLRAALAEVERRLIRGALEASKGNRTKAAETLGISRRMLFDKVREYDIRL